MPMTVDAAEGRCAKTGAKHRPGPIERLLLLGPTGRSCLGLFDTCPCDATALRIAQA